METVSLKEFYDALLAEKEKRYQQRFESTERAIDKAEEGFNARLALLNELRADVIKKGDFAAVEQKIADLIERVGRIDERKIAFGQGWGWLAGIAGLVLSAMVALTVMFKHS